MRNLAAWCAIVWGMFLVIVSLIMFSTKGINILEYCRELTFAGIAFAVGAIAIKIE